MVKGSDDLSPCWPRVLLRRVHDRHFLGPSNKWVPGPEQALDFGSARDAIVFFHQMHLDDSEIFFSYNDARLNSAFQLHRGKRSKR